MKEGEPIWVESLLSDKEYVETAKKYPNTFPKGNKKVAFFECEVKWRWGMGANVSAEEIKRVNSRLDEMRKLVKTTYEVNDSK